MHVFHRHSQEYRIIAHSKYFNKRWYLKTYPDVAKRDPVKHYLEYGWKEGNNPSKRFDGNKYLDMYVDVKEAYMCPLLHYIKYGKREGRSYSSYNCNNYASRRNRFLSAFNRKIYNILYSKMIKNNKSVKIAVHVHLFYEDLWYEIKSYLKNLEKYNYDLFITTPQQIPSHILQDINKFKSETNVFLVENKGFDVGPFIFFLHKINLKKYTIIFKLHTKRDVQARNYYGTYMKSGEWREMCYEAILGEKNIHKTINILSKNNNVGLVSHVKLISSLDTTYNKAETVRAMNKYGIPIPEEYKFILGTMFAGRSELFNNIKERVCVDDFSISQRGTFTLAHCFERILCLNVLAQGYSLKGENSFHLNSLLRKLQSKYYRFGLNDFYDTKMIKSYKFYKISNIKPITLCSILKNKDKELWNALTNGKKLVTITKGSVEYNSLLKELVSNRIVAKIISPFETTLFKLIGECISVEKNVKNNNLFKLLKIYNQPQKFVTHGRYLLDVLDAPLCSKNIKLLTTILYPYFVCVFNFFTKNNSKKLKPNAWDAIPRNTIIDKTGKYCFYDCNIRYVLNVSKSYFIYRVVKDLAAFANGKNVKYSYDELIGLYNVLCLKLGIKGNFKASLKLENNLMLHLGGKVSWLKILFLNIF